MIDFLFNTIVHAVPFVQAAWDSGLYRINQPAIQDYLLARVEGGLN